ncbi:MAG: polysaccharide biosynthesis C-terminal domain-containing protein [Mucilaginibacter sp.]
MNLLQKQGFYNSLILYAGTALGFFNLIILFQRYLTIQQIGFFTLMGAISLLYAQIASAGIGNIILKYFPYYRGNDKRHNGFSTFVLLWSVVGFVIITVFFVSFKSCITNYYKDKPGSSLLVQYYYYLIPLSFFTMTYTVLESMARAVFNNVLSAFLREVLLRVFTLISVLLIAAAIAGYYDFLMIYLAANVIITLILWHNIYKGAHFKFGSISARIIGQRKEMAYYGFFTVLSGSSFALIQNLDIIMLTAITMDLKFVGIYSTFFSIAMVISLPAKALSRTSLQIIAQAWAENDLPKIDKIYYKTSVVQMLIGCLLFIGLIINKQHIMALLHKPEYASYFDVFIMVGFGFLADMTGGVNGYIINISKHYKLTTYFITAAVMLCAVLNWLLIPVVGMMGAAISYFATMFTLNFVYWLFVYVKFSLQPFGRAHIVVILISLLTFAISNYVPVLPNFIADMILRSIIALVIYSGLSYYLKISEDINAAIDKVLK